MSLPPLLHAFCPLTLIAAPTFQQLPPMRTAMLSGVKQTAPKQIFDNSFTPMMQHIFAHIILYDFSFTWKIRLYRRQVPPESAAVEFLGK